MQLSQWYKQQREQGPSDIQKMRMYNQFLDKSHRVLAYEKVSYYAKMAVFSLGLLLIGGAMYYSLQPGQIDDGYRVAHIDDAFVTLEKTVSPGQVQADTIGEIIRTRGDVTIVQWTTQIETDTLRANERVLLAANAEMEFTVREDVKAKIIGPAEFELQYLGKQDGNANYAINLISGDYLEVVSLPTIPSEEIRDGEEEIIKENIIVQAPNFTIEKTHTYGKLDVVISTNNAGEKEVENKGTEIVMKKIIAEEQTYVAIDTQQKVAVNADIEFIIDEREVIALKQHVEEKKLSVQYDVTDTADESSDTAISAAVLLDTARGNEDKTKQVIPADQLQDLKKSIAASFLARNVEQMQLYYRTWDQGAYIVAHSNLISKITRGYSFVTSSAPALSADTTALGATATALEGLINALDTQYYIDPSLFVGLSSAAEIVRDLATESFGSEDISSLEWDVDIQDKDTWHENTDQESIDVPSSDEDIGLEGLDDTLEEPAPQEDTLTAEDLLDALWKEE